jgi:spermidine synthase
LELVEEIAHLPMLQHSFPQKVLILGGGLGGVLKEVLTHDVTRVTYVELDPVLIDLVKAYSPEIHVLLDDPRVESVHMDGRLFIKKPNTKYDVVIVNLPPPSTLQLNRYYSKEFFLEVEDALEEDGVISIGLPSSTAHISLEMSTRNRCVYNTIESVFPSCIVVPGYHNLFIASKNSEEHALTNDPYVISQRIIDRDLDTALLTEDYLVNKFDPQRMEKSLAYLNGKYVGLNRDMRPIATFYDLALWNTMIHPQMRSLFSLPSDVNIWLLLLTFCVMVLFVSSILRRTGRSQAPIYLAIFTTGLAGMTFSIINLYVFQALCGFLYQDLGVVAAAFMLGLALGGWNVGHRKHTQVKGVSTLIKIELSIIAFSLVIPPVISILSTQIVSASNLFLVRLFIPILNIAAGFLVGMEFPLASGVILEQGNQVGSVGGALYSTDLVGACVGSFFSSIWLIPLYGIQGSCLVVAAANLASLIWVYSVMK